MVLKVERGRRIYWNQLLISKSSVATIIKWEHLKQRNKQTEQHFGMGVMWWGYIQSSAELFIPTIHSSNHHSSSGHFKDVTCQLKGERLQVPSDNTWSLTSGETCQLWGHNSSFPRVLCRGKLDYQWPRKGEGYSDKALEKLSQRHDM